MQYQGGKHKLAKRIAAEIRSLAPSEDSLYIEPFVGGGSVLAAMDGWPMRMAADANRALITLWKALQRGWVPPIEVTEEQWYEHKRTQPPGPMTAFLGIGCSFMGMWYSSPAPQLAPRAQRTLFKKIKKMSDVTFVHSRYQDLEVHADDVVYCDPPYANTAGYKAVSSFDHDEFWGIMESWAAHGAVVLVSEYSAPHWVGKPHRSWTIHGGMARAPRTENLYVLSA